MTDGLLIFDYYTNFVSTTSYLRMTDGLIILIIKQICKAYFILIARMTQLRFYIFILSRLNMNVTRELNKNESILLIKDYFSFYRE